MANLVKFSNTQTVKNDYFRQAWFELYFASYNNKQLVSSSRLDSLSRYYSLNGTLIIGAINESFNYFDSSAFATGQLVQNTNGAIQPQTPHFSYKQKWLAMAGVVYNQDWLTNVNAIMLPEKALFGKAGVPIKKATILFNNGSSLVLQPGQTLPLQLSIADTTALVTIELKNGSSFSNKVYLPIEHNNTQQANRTNVIRPEGCFVNTLWQSNALPYNQDCDFQGYEEAQAYPSFFNIAYYYRSSVQCDGFEKSIENPIVILDGFDPEAKHIPEWIYNNFFFYNVAVGGKKNICEQLQAQGFDVILIDMPAYSYGTLPNGDPRTIIGGSDYIERNAMGLVAYLRWLNTQIPQGQTISLVGPSMGGQISRYALNYMEHRGEQHNVKLWISMDSPHEGANVAIGIQTLINDMAQQSAEARMMRDVMLNSPAAKQQIIHHYLSNSETPMGAPDFHDRYYEAQNNWGWPTQCRKIAMVSGAIDGTPIQDGNGGNNLMDIVWQYDYQLWSWGPTITENIVRFQIWNAPNFGNSNAVSNLWNKKDGDLLRYAQGFEKSNKSIDWIPGGQFNYIELVAKELGHSNLSQINVPIPLTNWSFNLNVGSSEVHSIIENAQDPTCFIPTASAIALNNGTAQQYGGKWDDNLSLFMYRCENVYTPFDYIMGPRQVNYRHDELFEEQANEIIDELRGNYHVFPKKPEYLTISPQYSAIGQWCTGDIKTFSVSPQSDVANGNYIWTLKNEPAFQIVGGQGTPNVQIQYLGGWIPPNPMPRVNTVQLGISAEGSCKLYNNHNISFNGNIFCEQFRTIKTPFVNGDNVFFELNKNGTSSNEQFTIQWFDMSGRLLAKANGTFNGNKIISKLPSNLAKGVFVAKISGNKINVTEKVVIN